MNEHEMTRIETFLGQFLQLSLLSRSCFNGIFYPLALLMLLPLAAWGQEADGAESTEGDSITNPMVHCRQYTESHPLIYEDYSDLPPYSFIDERGNKTGYNVELVDELLNSLDIPHKVVLKHISDAYSDLRNGQADLILSIKAPKRMEDGIYGKVPISVFTTSLLAPRSKPLNVRRVRELGDNKVLVHTGSFALDIMRERGMASNALPVADMTQAIMQISRQDSGMVVWNTMSMKYFIQTLNLHNLMLTPIHDLHTELSFMSHDTILLAKLDSIYLVRQSDAKLLDLRRKWFYPETEVEDYSYLWGLLGGVVFLGVIAMVVYFWIHQRERRFSFNLIQQNLQLALYLKTGGITMWTYKVQHKQFCHLNGQGVEEDKQDPSAFGGGYHPEDFANTLVALEQIAAGEKDTHHDIVRKLDEHGLYQYYNLQLSVLERDSRRHPRTILGLQSNTTEQRQKHLVLQETSLKFHTAFNMSNAWLLCFDRDGHLKNINLAACSEFGINNPQKLIADGFQLEDLPFDLSNTGAFEGREVWVSAQTDFDERRSVGRLNPHITAKGRAFHELIVTPVINSKGNRLATYVAGLNITDGVDTARESRDSKREIELIYRKSRLGMDNLSHSLAFAQVRMGVYYPAKRSLSFADTGMLSDISPLRLMVTVASEDRYRLVHIFNRLDKRLVKRFEFKCRTRMHTQDGMAHRVYETNLQPIVGADGLADHYIVLTRDISDMERLQEQLLHETAKAQEAEKIKNAFLRNMSAEIRRPLDRMLQSANALSGLQAAPDGADTKADALADDIHQTCRNLLSLVGDILTLSKIEAGIEETCIETVDMAVLFPAICQMSAATCDKTQIKVKVQSPYQTLNIDTDTNFVTRIIDGLFRSSLMTTQRGYIKASCEYFNGQLMMRVEDSGAGMTADQIAAVGDHRFSGSNNQYDLSIKLAIVQELARRLGGRLDIESAPGHGTTVWVTLPCVLRDFQLHTAEDNGTV